MLSFKASAKDRREFALMNTPQEGREVICGELVHCDVMRSLLNNIHYGKRQPSGPLGELLALLSYLFGMLSG